ncbi:MAG TPA: ferrous iron transport protein A [Thermoplasmatales archaeon]|nr:ferrous iron transport protein A [Thermoplasmatales archaeon]
MTAKILPLTSLLPGMAARIVDIQGGYGFQKKLHMMGLVNGKKLRMVSVQPLRGPITVEINSRQVTLGRGMANKVLVEVIR